jgi:hypothetical protein
MCDDYKRKEWCGLESRAIRGLMKAHQSNRIMLLTFDGKTIDGVSDIDGYWNISKESVDDVANAIYNRLKALDEPLPTSRSFGPLPPRSPENKISKMIVTLENTVHSISPWYIVVALLAYILGTLNRS